METHLERAQQLIADPLFEIGSHGLRHLDMSHAKEQTLGEEITLTAAAYSRARAALTSRQCFAGAVQQPPERLTLFRPLWPLQRQGARRDSRCGAHCRAMGPGHQRSGPARIAQDHRQYDSEQGASRRHRRGALPMRGRKSRGTRHRAAEAEGAGLWFRHGQRAAQGRQASDRGALLSEQPRRHDTRGQDLRSARQL